MPEGLSNEKFPALSALESAEAAITNNSTCTSPKHSVQAVITLLELAHPL